MAWPGPAAVLASNISATCDQLVKFERRGGKKESENLVLFFKDKFSEKSVIEN